MQLHQGIETIRYKSLENANLMSRNFIIHFYLKLKRNLMIQSFELVFVIYKGNALFKVSPLLLKWSLSSLLPLLQNLLNWHTFA
jgi:hypothetical protein